MHVYGDMQLMGSKVTEGIADYRLNTDWLLLPTAARTATTITPIQTNYNARGIIVKLNIAGVGTGQLQPTIRIYGLDLGNPRNLLAAPFITAVGTYVYIVYPGVGVASADVTDTASFPVPRSWDLGIGHTDASSWIYDAGVSSIL